MIDDIELENNIQCIFCLEDISENSYITYDLTDRPYFTLNQCLYVLSCECTPLIHKSCMTTWLTTKNSCPICLVGLQKYYLPAYPPPPCTQQCIKSWIPTCFIWIVLGIIVFLFATYETHADLD